MIKNYLLRFIKTVTPYRMINNSLPTFEYKISVKNNIFYIDADDEFKKTSKKKHWLVISFLQY